MALYVPKKQNLWKEVKGKQQINNQCDRRIYITQFIEPGLSSAAILFYQTFAKLIVQTMAINKSVQGLVW